MKQPELVRVDLTAADAWSAASEQYRRELIKHEATLADPTLQVQLFLGYQHALWEVTHGLAKLFDHKKTIALIGPTEPAFESIAMAFAAEGFSVKSVTREEAEKPEWVEAISRELLFVLVAEDDPVTGRVFDISAMDAVFKDKRIYTVLLSHASYKLESIVRPAPYRARIISIETEIALLIGGERVRIEPPVASRFPWRLDDAALVSRRLETVPTKCRAEWREKIEGFESQLPAGFQPYFKKGEGRAYDRVVIYHPEFDGFAVISEIARAMQIEIPAPGEASLLETTSPCRWESPRFAQWLQARGDDETIIRSLVIASVDMIDRGLFSQLEKAAESIRAIQEGI